MDKNHTDEVGCRKYTNTPTHHNRVPTAQGKQWKLPKKNAIREKTGNLEILPKHEENTGNFVCSSCTFPDSKGKEYYDTCFDNFNVLLEAGYICQVSFVYAIVTNHVNWQGTVVVGQGKNMEKDREFENAI